MKPLPARLSAGASVVLGKNTYTVLEFLGQGAVAEAYRIKFSDYEIILKLLNARWLDSNGAAAPIEPQDSDSPPPPDPYQQFIDEARVLKRLNEAEDDLWEIYDTVEERITRAQETAEERVIIANFDSGEVESDAGKRPYIIQEFAPPAVEYQPVTGVDDELKVLRIMTRVAQGIQLAHENEISLRDFKPLEKIDRIRVDWLADGQTPRVRLIDWNISGGPDLAVRDLFYFGYYLYYLLLGEEAEDPPPSRLGSGVAAWNTITEGSRFILRRLLHRDASRRYQSARALVDDLQWWLDTLAAAQKDAPADRLRERALDAMRRNRSDRLLAVAELALANELSEKDARTFRTFQTQAKDDLEKELRYAIASIQISLKAGQFSRAMAEADRELIHLDAESEAARRVRHLKLLAGVGESIKKNGGGDPRTLPVWQLVTDGVQDLIDHEWGDADQKFRNAENEYEALAASSAFRRLKELSAAGQLLTDAQALRESAKPYAPDIESENWEELEQKKIDILQQACDKFRQASEKAPQEVVMSDALRACEKELATRRSLVSKLASMKSALARRDFVGAAQILEDVLKTDAGNPYAQALRPAILRYARMQETIETGKRALWAGEYDKAEDHFDEAAQMMPEEEEAQKWLSLARPAHAVQRSMARRLHNLDRKLTEDPTADELVQIHNDLSDLAQLSEKPWQEVLDYFALQEDAEMLQNVPPEMLASYPEYVLNKRDEERMRAVRGRLAEAMAALAEKEQKRLDDLWRDGDFSGRNVLGERFLALLPADKRDNLTTLEAKIKGAQEAERTFRTALQNTAGQNPLDVIQHIQEATAGLVAQKHLPANIRNDAEAIVATLTAFLNAMKKGSAGATILTDVFPKSRVLWLPLQQAYSASIKAAESEVSNRAEKAYLQKDFRSVKFWLADLEKYRKYLNDKKKKSLEESTLNDTEKEWLKESTRKLEAYDEVGKKIDSVKSILTENATAGISSDRAEGMANLLRETWGDISGDHSPLAEGFREEIRSLWRQMIHAMLQEGAAKKTLEAIRDRVDEGLKLFTDDAALSRDSRWLGKALVIASLNQQWTDKDKQGEVAAPDVASLPAFVGALKEKDGVWHELLDEKTVGKQWARLQRWTQAKLAAYHSDMALLMRQWRERIQKHNKAKQYKEVARYDILRDLKTTHLWTRGTEAEELLTILQEATTWRKVQKDIDDYWRRAEAGEIPSEISNLLKEYGKKVKDYLDKPHFRKLQSLMLLLEAEEARRQEPGVGDKSTHIAILEKQAATLDQLRNVIRFYSQAGGAVEAPGFLIEMKPKLLAAMSATASGLAAALETKTNEVLQNADSGNADVQSLVSLSAQAERADALLSTPSDLDDDDRRALAAAKEMAGKTLLCDILDKLLIAMDGERFAVAQKVAETIEAWRKAYEQNHSDGPLLRTLNDERLNHCSRYINGVISLEEELKQTSVSPEYFGKTSAYLGYIEGAWSACAEFERLAGCNLLSDSRTEVDNP